MIMCDVDDVVMFPQGSWLCNTGLMNAITIITGCFCIYICIFTDYKYIYIYIIYAHICILCIHKGR